MSHVEREKCREMVNVEVGQGDVVVDIMLLQPCAAPVRAWRTCGRGCDHSIAYCAEHGGDSRAAEEMARHHAEAHRE